MILLSSTIYLNQKEITLFHQHHKNTLQHFQKLHDETPQSFIYFMAGSLPATAIIHICQFCLFGMICRLPADPLQIHCISNKHALHVLTVAKQNDLSWFSRIRTLCLQYSLPHPLTFLNSPPTKMKYKNIIKSKVMDSWERKLRNDEVSKAVIQ